jgi:hypothetical protein
MLPGVIAGPPGCLGSMGSAPTTSLGIVQDGDTLSWLVRVDMLTERTGHGFLSEDSIRFILRRRRFGNWNSLATVRAVDCDVPLIGLNAIVHH